MARHAIVVALPTAESDPVCVELAAAGFEAIAVQAPYQLEALLDSRRDVAVAILDGEIEPDDLVAYQHTLRERGRAIPALTVVTPSAYEELAVAENDGRKTWANPRRLRSLSVSLRSAPP